MSSNGQQDVMTFNDFLLATALLEETVLPGLEPGSRRSEIEQGYKFTINKETFVVPPFSSLSWKYRTGDVVVNIFAIDPIVSGGVSAQIGLVVGVLPGNPNQPMTCVFFPHQKALDQIQYIQPGRLRVLSQPEDLYRRASNWAEAAKQRRIILNNYRYHRSRQWGPFFNPFVVAISEQETDVLFPAPLGSKVLDRERHLQQWHTKAYGKPMSPEVLRCLFNVDALRTTEAMHDLHVALNMRGDETRDWIGTASALLEHAGW